VTQYIDIICVSIHNACLLCSSTADWLNKSHSTWDEFNTNGASKCK